MGDLASQLRVIAEAAPALRKAGVSTVRLGDVEFTLHGEAIEMRTTTTTQPEPRNAFEDHNTYGLAEGSTLPGFRDPRKKAAP